MRHWFLSQRMGLEMASEFKEFLTTLEPVWEDPHEFDWLKEIKISSLERMT